MRRSIVVLLACGSVFGACYVTGPPAGFECTQDSDCDRGSLCIDAECFEVCTLQMHCGEGQYCSPDGICVENPPRISAPTGLSAEGGLSKVTVTWEPVSGAVSYNIYWAVEPGVTTASTRESTTAPPFEHRSLVNGTTYYYAVSAVDESGEGDLSDEVSATALGPSAPTGVSAEGGMTQVTLTWEPVSGADSYNIYWALQSGVTTESSRLTATAPPLVHAPLTNGTPYYYAVSSVVEGSESVLSDEVLGTPRVSAPTGVVAEGGLERVTITWEPVEGADSYDLYWALEPGVTTDSEVVVGVTSPFVHASLASYTEYYYAVVANDGPSESLPSNEVSVSTFLSVGARLWAPVMHAGDLFGSSVAMDGSYAIVGAPCEDGDGDGLGDAGAAYVFHRTEENTWDAGTKLVATNPAAGMKFGNAVAISGDYAIVGVGSWSGSRAFVFHRTDENAWDSVQELSGTTAFGVSVAISGDYAVVGDVGGDVGADGFVTVFHRTATNTWEASASLGSPDARANDWFEETFGRSVALLGDYTVVSAQPWEVEDTGPSDAYVYVFENRDPGDRLESDDTGSRHLDFGQSLGITADHLVVGTSGAAYVYRRTGTNVWELGPTFVSWQATGTTGFGRAVAISADGVLVGAHAEDWVSDELMSDAGASYLFHRTEPDGWDDGIKLVAPDAQAGDRFGSSVALSGGYAIVGAPSAGGVGAAYIYEY